MYIKREKRMRFIGVAIVCLGALAGWRLGHRGGDLHFGFGGWFCGFCAMLVLGANGGGRKWTLSHSVLDVIHPGGFWLWFHEIIGNLSAFDRSRG